MQILIPSYLPNEIGETRVYFKKVEYLGVLKTKSTFLPTSTRTWLILSIFLPKLSKKDMHIKSSSTCYIPNQLITYNKMSIAYHAEEKMP